MRRFVHFPKSSQRFWIQLLDCSLRSHCYINCNSATTPKLNMPLCLVLAHMRRQRALAASIVSTTAGAVAAAPPPPSTTTVPAAVLKLNAYMILSALPKISSLGVESRLFTSSPLMMSNDLPERSSSYYRVPPKEEMPFAQERSSVAERKSLGESCIADCTCTTVAQLQLFVSVPTCSVILLLCCGILLVHTSCMKSPHYLHNTKSAA